MMSYGHDGLRDFFVLVLACDFHADSAVAEEATRGVEHGLAADAKMLARPVGIGATQGEIKERLARIDPGLQRLTLPLVPPTGWAGTRITHQRIHADAEHVEDRAGHLGKTTALVLLPIPIGGEFGEAAVTRFAFA